MRLIVLLLLFNNLAFSNEIRRDILAIYDSKESELRVTKIHRYAQMPLNHLGLNVIYHDINDGIPELSNYSNLRGVLTWFTEGTQMTDPEKYLDWASSAIDSGYKFVIMGVPGFYQNKKDNNTSIVLINNFFRRLGIRDLDEWVNLTFDTKISYIDKDITEFERKYEGFKPPYQKIGLFGNKSKSFLKIEKINDKNSLSDLIVISNNGAYVAKDYAVHFDPKTESRSWFIDPFKFFSRAYNTDDFPKPDTTSISNRRIYYSHIDGDGWINHTQLQEYKNSGILSSQIVLERAIMTNPDLPVSVAPIAAEISLNWEGTYQSINIAKNLFALDYIEIGNHTLSHPFYWDFFSEGDFKKKEMPFLDRYRGKKWKEFSATDRLLNLIKPGLSLAQLEKLMPHGYDTPRGFAAEPFDLEKEIIGSTEMINAISPKDKKVKILMWSGDTTPFKEALKMTREIGLENINGGDSRFDREFPSYAWVSALNRQVGEEMQIYASNSNENTYTDLWTGRFHGFTYLKRTIKNTESPIRLKPFNVYYHMYSGEKTASLNALLDNLSYAKEVKIAPITTSHFSKIAKSFPGVKIIQAGQNKWQIKNRNYISSFRLDKALYKTIDIANSKGIIGFQHYQGSLYITLDKTENDIVIAIKDNDITNKYVYEGYPYLVGSRWQAYNLNKDRNKYIAEGFGNSETSWVVKNGLYEVRALKDNKIIYRDKIKVKDNVLNFNIKESAISPIQIQINQL